MIHEHQKTRMDLIILDIIMPLFNGIDTAKFHRIAFGCLFIFYHIFEFYSWPTQKIKILKHRNPQEYKVSHHNIVYPLPDIFPDGVSYLYLLYATKQDSGYEAFALIHRHL